MWSSGNASHHRGDDGSNAVKNLTDGAFTITGKPSKGSPVNALGTIPLTSGQYFEVTCQD